MPFRCSRNSTSLFCPCGQITKVSSTYLYQQAGLWVAVLWRSSQILPCRNLRWPGRVESPWLHHPFVRKIVRPCRNKLKLIHVCIMLDLHLWSVDWAMWWLLPQELWWTVITTSKLTIISPGLVRRDFSISMKWKEFLTLCTDFPMSGLRSPDRCFESLYVGRQYYSQWVGVVLLCVSWATHIVLVVWSQMAPVVFLFLPWLGISWVVVWFSVLLPP